MIWAQYYDYSNDADVVLFFLVIFAVIEVVFGLVAAAFWKNKGGTPGAGFALGFFLGGFGLMAAAAGTPSRAARGRLASDLRECPHCKEFMQRSAGVCPHCQRESAAWTFHSGRWWVQGQGGAWHYLEGNRWVQAPQPAAATSPPAEPTTPGA